EAYLRTISDERELPPADRVVYSLQEQLAKHLTRECGLSPAMIESLLQPKEKEGEELTAADTLGRADAQIVEEIERQSDFYATRKQFYYVATRVAFIYSTVEQWTAAGREQGEKESLWSELLSKHLEGKAKQT
ncbi:unnamed protein product, partial [Amoebophrya sp. A25]